MRRLVAVAILISTLAGGASAQGAFVSMLDVRIGEVPVLSDREPRATVPVDVSYCHDAGAPPPPNPTRVLLAASSQWWLAASLNESTLWFETLGVPQSAIVCAKPQRVELRLSMALSALPGDSGNVSVKVIADENPPLARAEASGAVVARVAEDSRGNAVRSPTSVAADAASATASGATPRGAPWLGVLALALGAALLLVARRKSS